MQFDDVILGRRSIRGYKPDPVPRKLIEEIIALAMRAPSSMNTQPWNFYVITGEPLDRIRAGNTERMVAGVPQSREFRTGQAFAGQHRDRQVGVAKQLFAAMGIKRDDTAMRQDWVLRGFRQFDAPVCVIVTYDRAVDGSDDTPFDCGAVATALVNAAWSRGLGAVINSQGIMQSPVVREHAIIGDDHAHRRVELPKAAQHPVLAHLLVVAGDAHGGEQLLGDADLAVAMRAGKGLPGAEFA